ncbi:MAG: hypothetical protein H0X29_09580 [Parachlamydiaceae bacterium]|nr:hypothetical protein [Parachlamydiaceae bacterium]
MNIISKILQTISILSIPLSASCVEEYKPILISSADAEAVGRKIWRNECGGTITGLTSWNQGEDFPSLGICHFIWYFKGQVSPFCEIFPDVLAFLVVRGVVLPDWLAKDRACPWSSRDEFMQQLNSPQMVELRELLQNTICLQAEFMALRLQKSLPVMVSKFPQAKRQQMIKSFNLLMLQPQGLYAILDYLNFKGEGLLPTEAYQGEGWGLIQVLETMKESQGDESILNAFVEAANDVLERRVANSPIERNEKRWLKGWQNRTATYLRAE